MLWNDLDLNSIIIVVIAICIGIIKVVEIYKSGTYRNTKLNNSKEEMKQVEALRNKYREKFKNKIKDVKEDVIKEIKNKKFNDELENIIGEINRLTELYNNTNNIISSSSEVEMNKVNNNSSLESTSNSEVEIKIQK